MQDVFLIFGEFLVNFHTDILCLSTEWSIIKMLGGREMTTSDMIRELCEKMNISISELARRIGQSSQNFNKKLKRDTVNLKELTEIADVLGVTFEQSFLLPDGTKIQVREKVHAI